MHRDNVLLLLLLLLLRHSCVAALGNGGDEAGSQVDVFFLTLLHLALSLLCVHPSAELTLLLVLFWILFLNAASITCLLTITVVIVHWCSILEGFIKQIRKMVVIVVVVVAKIISRNNFIVLLVLVLFFVVEEAVLRETRRRSWRASLSSLEAN